VNARRHRHYRRALVLILAFEESTGMAESDLLRRLAQDMLLTRDPDTGDIDALLDPLALALSRMVNDEILPRAVATELWREIQACGPPLLHRRPVHEQLEVAAGGART
jgi:hypothetical protein